ncbi:bacterial type II and III secretion system family protein [Collimonas arenae]|uniref:Bacterial type II and III secretion system family protein n=1 Tax=Collimonas arenae TaxID=279058 RepID=A0A127QF48_9BURK|nr:bacterial type II and III secretion system family protein [Collimonas arenae]AMP08242.1 bacterial type II and III secretion system family protein [Collimonas arenae]
MAYRDGKELIAQDKIEEGLAKFKDASAQDPQNYEYRIAYSRTKERAISAYLMQADNLAGVGKRPEAEQFYQRILTIDPSNDRARSGLLQINMSERHASLMKEAQLAWEKKNTDMAQMKLRIILSENPNDANAQALQRAIEEKNSKHSPESSLSAAYKKKISIDFKDAALRQIFDVISRTADINFLFDKDIKTDQKTSIFLRNSTIESAIHYTLLTNQLEQQVLDANTILIYPNTAAKQKDYQEMVIKTFFLANAEAKTVANTLKSILKSRDIVVDDKLNMVILRDSPEAVKLAEKLVALHDAPEPEVMLEVEVLEVSRTRLLDLGIQWPSSLSLTPLPLGTPVNGSNNGTNNGSSSTGNSTLSLRDLLHQNSGSIAAGISPMTITANKTDSDANLLANPRIRARNHEKAKILIGQRVPNITTTATSTGFVSESINYVDVGLTLNVEPTIYLDSDVGIKVSLEVSNIIGQLKTQSGSVAYQIGTRTASTVLRLKDGENQVLAGLINDEDRRSGNKVPGLGELPVVGRLFGSNSDNNQKTEIVLSITPHLIRNIQRPDAALSEFRSGTDTSFRVRPDSMRDVQREPLATPVEAPASTSKSAPTPSSSTGTTGNTSGGTNTPISGNSGSINGGSQGYPANSTQLQWSGPTQVKAGDTFAVQLMMQSAQPVASLPIVLGFDSRVILVENVIEGDFLKQGGAQTNFNSQVDNSGKIQIVDTRSGGNGGATALGAIATINFKALSAADISQVHLLAITPLDATGNPVSVGAPSPYQIQVQAQ